MEKQQEVDNTEIINEGGDMKVSEPKVKEEKSKKPSARQEDGSYKVNLSENPKTEEDAGKTLSKGDESKVSNKEEKEEKVEEKVDTPVLEEITDSEKETPKKVEKEEPVVESTKETTPGMELPENVEKLVKFMNETGGTIEDYVKLNTDYSKLEDSDLLKDYYRQTKGHLSGEEIDFLIEDKFNFDEDADDPTDIKRKKLAYKEAVAEARNVLETNKKTYFDELKLGSRLSPDQQKAVNFFNRYNKEQEPVSYTHLTLPTICSV